MDAARWSEAAALFEALADADAETRRRRLGALDASDPDLARYVRELLAADAVEDPTLEGNAADIAPAAVEDLVESGPPRSGRIGPWRLIERIARGGMGEVYLAQRDDGQYEQQAALKLLRRGMDSDQILRRFLQERRILARLQHPNIARLLDGGMGSDCQPYFAMEYVAGKPINRFCSERGCELEQRIGLLIQACEAVEFAHRNLVVHRDLKPSNILVGDDGEVKLLDFGIAKLIDDTEGDHLTHTGMRLLTPAYASPEQIRGEAATTATDVYSLGVVLYELLTGELPHSRASASPQAMAESLQTESILRPSAVIARTTQTQGDARQRQRFMRRVQGDLDTIVLKALKGEPERRYRSAGALAEDLQRFLDGRPIRARPDSRTYRLRKFVVRHRVGVATATALLASLVFGLGAALWQAEVARANAETAASQAQRAEATKDFLVRLFRQADPLAQAKGTQLSAVDLLRNAAARVGEELGDAPDSQAELRAALAQSLLNLGDQAAAADLAATAEAQIRALHGPLHPRRGDALLTLARSLEERQELDPAEAQGREALAIFERAGAGFELNRIQARSFLAKQLNARGRRAEALVQYRAILDDRIAMGGQNALGLAEDWNNIGNTLLMLDQEREAVDAFQRTGEILTRTSGAQHPRMAWVHLGLAHAHLALGELDDAAAEIERSTAVVLAVMPSDHPLTANIASSRGLLALARERPDAAAEAFADAIARGQRNNATVVAYASGGLGLAELRRGQLDAAAAALEDSIRRLQQRGTSDPYLRHVQAARALIEVRRGKLDALAEIGHALDALEAEGNAGLVYYADTALLQAEALALAGRTDDAVIWRERAIAVLRTLYGDAHPRVQALTAGRAIADA